MRYLLVLLLLLLVAPAGAQETPAGTVLKEAPNAIGEYTVRLEAGHTLQRGDVVKVCRAGQEQPLGEAFVKSLNGPDAVISLKGDFPTKAGDVVVFARRPGPVQSIPDLPPPAAADLDGEGEDEDTRTASAPRKPSPGSVQDPNGRFSLKVPAGWTIWPQQAQPDAVAIIGPNAEFLLVGTRNSEAPEGMLNDPNMRKGFAAFMAAAMKGKDIKMTGERKVKMFGRDGLWMDFQGQQGIEGFMMLLPSGDHIFIGVGVAQNAAGVKAAEKVLRTVKYL